MRLHRRFDHRAAVGGLWDEIGALQFEFLVGRGLRPSDHLLDVGCGSLRGGIHFVRYLEPGHYYGIDAERRYLDGGRRELLEAGVDPASVTLVHDDRFEFSRTGRTFSWALAQSVFTHLPLNSILRCLGEMERVLEPGGRFFATFFRSPGPRLGLADHRASDEVTTHLDSDPFHYDPDVFRWAVEGSKLELEVIGEWEHPRNQEMLLFTRNA